MGVRVRIGERLRRIPTASRWLLGASVARPRRARPSEMHENMSLESAHLVYAPFAKPISWCIRR